MSEREMEEALIEVLSCGEALELLTGEPRGEVSIRSYREAGVLTNNRGLVIEVCGRTYQLTIVEV